MAKSGYQYKFLMHEKIAVMTLKNMVAKQVKIDNCAFLLRWNNVDVLDEVDGFLKTPKLFIMLFDSLQVIKRRQSSVITNSTAITKTFRITVL